MVNERNPEEPMCGTDEEFIAPHVQWVLNHEEYGIELARVIECDPRARPWLLQSVPRDTEQSSPQAPISPAPLTLAVSAIDPALLPVPAPTSAPPAGPGPAPAPTPAPAPAPAPTQPAQPQQLQQQQQYPVPSASAMATAAAAARPLPVYTQPPGTTFFRYDRVFGCMHCNRTVDRVRLIHEHLLTGHSINHGQRNIDWVDWGASKPRFK